jgi:Tfp pilus assembly PilM family ATPase
LRARKKSTPVFSKETIILECAASRTALARFSRQGDRVRLEQHAEIGLPEPIATEDRWLEHTHMALAALSGRIKAAGPVTLVLPPHALLTRIIRAPRAGRAERGKVVRFAAEESLPCALADVVWAHVAAAEHDLEVMLAAAKLEVVEPLCAAAKAAGFTVKCVLPAPLATLAAFRLTPAVKEPSLVLNIGARSTTLLIVAGGRFVTRTLPMGARGVGAGGNEAREAFVTRLGQEVTRSLLHFRRQGSLADPARVRLTGGGASLAGLRDAVAARLQLPADDLNVPAAVEMGNQMSVAETAPTSRLTDLAGAAAIQLRPGQAVMNLLPPSLRPRHRQRRRLWLSGTTALMVAGGWALWPERVPEVAPARRVTSQEATVAASEQTAALAPAPERVESASAVLELIKVEPDPCRLRVAGYFGEPGNYMVALVGLDRPETRLVRAGQRLEPSGLVLRDFEVRKIAGHSADNGPVYEMAGFAWLQDAQTGREFRLDSRRRKLGGAPHAVLRVPGAAQPRVLIEGDWFWDAAGAYRIERIQLEPPEIVVAMRAPGSPAPEQRILRPVAPEAETTPRGP